MKNSYQMRMYLSDGKTLVVEYFTAGGAPEPFLTSYYTEKDVGPDKHQLLVKMLEETKKMYVRHFLPYLIRESLFATEDT